MKNYTERSENLIKKIIDKNKELEILAKKFISLTRKRPDELFYFRDYFKYIIDDEVSLDFLYKSSPQPCLQNCSFLLKLVGTSSQLY